MAASRRGDRALVVHAPARGAAKWFESAHERQCRACGAPRPHTRHLNKLARPTAMAAHLQCQDDARRLGQICA